MDGFSSDDTLNIARSFKDDRIRIYSEKDKGVYDAMNKGIKLAKGDWLLFLGSDDTLYSSKVLGEVAREANNYDVIYGNVYSSRFGGLYDGEFSESKIIAKNICHQAIFYKKTVFDKVGYYNTRYKSQADWDHNLRWFLSEGIKHKFVNITVANFADGGLSSRNQDVDFVVIRRWKYNMLRKKQIKFTDKLKIIAFELASSVYHKKRKKFITVISQIPYFLFSIQFKLNGDSIGNESNDKKTL